MLVIIGDLFTQSIKYLDYFLGCWRFVSYRQTVNSMITDNR
ncbi:hypothetical protein N44_01749 [Microcystis aeruginosa NIES-44]|uniref:Uncharacterized protein n=1 Tax=Microcystis aeruginosa NIES-44 TaxID=449439 RepID=A0A0A1VTC0_MICAE|nr:hypothetical protein N44_01749 [Microcystis aeruginosa NIES-44]